MATTIEICLAACYARGAPRPFDPPRGVWAAVSRAMRASGADLGQAPEVLRAYGLWAEALVLSDRAAVDWAESRLEARTLLTVESPEYPRRLRARLGDHAPPVVWVQGRPPERPLIAIVGRRHADLAARGFAQRSAFAALRLGYAICTGGAKGVDRAAADAAGPQGEGDTVLVELLPHGIGLRPQGQGCSLSLAAPDDPFSAGLAMERNQVLYAMSEAAIVVGARFKSGGAWHGAVDALRRRLTKVLVWQAEGDLAYRALVALGATPIGCPSDLPEALQATPLQPELSC